MDIVEWLEELSTPERRKHGSPPDIAMKDAADKIKLLRKNAEQDARYLLAYHRICQKHGIAPSSSDLIAAMKEDE